MDAVYDLADDRPGPEAEAINSSQRAQIEACMNELEPKHADCVKRSYFEGETYKDLAARQDIPLNTMRTWLRRSLQKLKECLTR